MYYDNKSSFYVRQYGPVVLVIIFSILLISSGLYIYLNTNKSDVKQEVAQEVKNENTNTENKEEVKNTETETKQEVVEETKTEQNTNNSTSTTNLDEVLSILEKASEGTVKSVNDSGSVNVQIKDELVEVNFIGVDYSKSPSDTIKKIKEDLQDKKVKIAFDTQKTEDSKVYAYVYLDDKTLYNEKILKNGLAVLRVERNNTSLLDVLLSAQKDARANSVGLWNI
ncbi:MAG: thermonuclease family protein [Clostridia bacterium]|nr:thermonuclease family protein [Clostridia bacterium]